MKIKIKVVQVAHGIHFEGEIDIGGQVFIYTLMFGIPADHLKSELEKQTRMRATKYQDLFPLEVLDSKDKTLKLSPEEHFFLLKYIGSLALALYKNVQDRRAAEPAGRLRMAAARRARPPMPTVQTWLERSYTIPDEEVPQKFHPVAV